MKILLFTFQIHISTSKIHLIQIIDNWIKITALDRTNTILYKKGKKYDKYSSACIISLFLSLSSPVHIYLFRKQRQARHEASRLSSSVKVTPSRARSSVWRGECATVRGRKREEIKIPPSFRVFVLIGLPLISAFFLGNY